MPRIRSIKPEFFTDETIAELQPIDRLVFIGLWTLADKAGRLEDRPRRIKAMLLPYDNVDITKVLDRLLASRFVLRYEVEGVTYLQIRTWTKHQRPHHTEAESDLPAPLRAITVMTPSPHGEDSMVSSPVHGEAPVSLDHGSGNGSGKGVLAKASVRALDGFDTFWASYPRHVAKGDAQKAWATLRPPPALQAAIVAALTAQRTWRTWADPVYVPYPASWLRAQRWLDEPPAPPEVSPLESSPSVWHCGRCGEVHEGTDAQYRAGWCPARVNQTPPDGDGEEG